MSRWPARLQATSWRQLCRWPQWRREQWKTLLHSHPASWPRSLRYCLYLLTFTLPLLSGAATFLTSSIDIHQATAVQEQQQKMQYQEKLQQLHQLAPLLQRRQQLLEQIRELLPHIHADGAAHLLLSEVAAYAAANQLMLESAQPANAAPQQHSEALALQLRLRGSYHDIGRFSATLAAATRPLWLSDIHLTSDDKQPHLLSLDAAVITYLQPRQHEAAQP